jgi:hypothetical protein
VLNYFTSGIRRLFVQAPDAIALQEQVDQDIVSLDRVVQTVHTAIVKSNQGSVRLEGVNAMLTIVMNDSILLNPESLKLVLRACFDVLNAKQLLKRHSFKSSRSLGNDWRRRRQC